MKEKKCWIVRTTLDVYKECLLIKRVGANERILNRLKKISIGDFGVFYISTSELHKSSETISEFTTPFIFTGQVESIQINVETLPSDKSLEHSIAIEFYGKSDKCKISNLIETLDFIKKKNYWGSYFMQPFIKITKRDFQIISEKLGVKP